MYTIFCYYKTAPLHRDVKVTYLYKIIFIISLSRQNDMYKAKITLPHLMYSEEEYILFCSVYKRKCKYYK